MKPITEFEHLTGETIIDVVRSDGDGDVVTITLADGRKFQMRHWQDCCESVYLEDIEGDLSDMVGRVISAYKAVSSEMPVDGDHEDFMWTFYRIQTDRGVVVLRWYGHSNGYYSVSVSFGEVK